LDKSFPLPAPAVVWVPHRRVLPPVYTVGSAAHTPPVPLRGLPMARNLVVHPHSTPAVEGVGVARSLVVVGIVAEVRYTVPALGRTVDVVAVRN